ncbi:MAG: hypothetical protein WCW02_03905 [Candidatus Buchananbacteria bacterium]
MDKLTRLINLIQKTGDKLVITDTAGNSAYVIMNLKDYERFILGQSDVADLTEEELLSKINRDIALWKAGQSNDILSDLSQKLAKEELESVANNPLENNTDFVENKDNNKEDQYYIEPVENL